MKSALTAVVAIACAFAFAGVEPGENLIVNPRFVTDQGNSPDFWNLLHGTAKFSCRPVGGPGDVPYVSIDAAGGAGGSPSLRQYGLRLHDKGRYRLSGWVRKREFSAVRSGFVIASAGWKRDEGVIFENGSCDWRRFTKEFTAFPSDDGMWFAAFYANTSEGRVDLADVRLEAIDEETAARTETSALLEAQDRPRLVPWSPMLNEIPKDEPKVTFRFFGKLPEGEDSDYDVLTEVGGITNRMVLIREGTTVPLPPGVKGWKFIATVVNRRSGRVVFSRRYPFSTVRRCVDHPVGRRLNNMVREIFNEPLSEGSASKLEFGMAHAGWVYVSVAADTVKLDGTTVITGTTPRHETFRELKAGDHVLCIKGARQGSVVVRRMPEILNYCPGVMSRVKENPPYDWEFQERFVLPGVTTLNAGNIPPAVRSDVRDRGYKWLANLHSLNPADGLDIARRLAGCKAMRADSPYDGVTCDEQFLRILPAMDRYAESMWAYVGKPGRHVYTWVVGKPTISGVHHDLIASAANATFGHGKVLGELYCETQSTEDEARAYLRERLAETHKSFTSAHPSMKAKYGVILGNFNQVPALSLCLHPEVDYRYYLDMQFNMLANDPEFQDLACTGVWGSYYADEELHRWTFMLTRHYCIEGRKEMLSARYGFKYAPGHIVNPDFKEGFAAWNRTGCVGLGQHSGFGKESESRWSNSSSLGDTFAVLPGRGEDRSLVSQVVRNLQPGRPYVLRFATFDVDDAKAGRNAPRRLDVVAKLSGAEVDKSLSWTHVDEHVDKKGARVNYTQIVFRPSTPEVTIEFSNEDSETRRDCGLNCVSLLPYLSRVASWF